MLGECIDVACMNQVGENLYQKRTGTLKVMDPAKLRARLCSEAKDNKTGFSGSFVLTEWDQVVDGWQLHTIPNKPNSRLQQYRLTPMGRALLATLDTK